MKCIRSCTTSFLLGSIVIATAGCQIARIPKATFIDKCKGAWAGQMIGVCYGAPYEFRSNAKPITKPLQPWRPDRVNGAIRQDDCYVEMTFLKALEDHGLDITLRRTGILPRMDMDVNKTGKDERLVNLTRVNRVNGDDRPGFPVERDGSRTHSVFEHDLTAHIPWSHPSLPSKDGGTFNLGRLHG